MGFTLRRSLSRFRLSAFAAACSGVTCSLLFSVEADRVVLMGREAVLFCSIRSGCAPSVSGSLSSRVRAKSSSSSSPPGRAVGMDSNNLCRFSCFRVNPATRSCRLINLTPLASVLKWSKLVEMLSYVPKATCIQRLLLLLLLLLDQDV